MKILVLTVKGQPEFEFYPSCAQQVAEIVRRKYGCQPDGKPHNWEGLTSKEIEDVT